MILRFLVDEIVMKSEESNVSQNMLADSLLSVTEEMWLISILRVKTIWMEINEARGLVVEQNQMVNSALGEG